MLKLLEKLSIKLQPLRKLSYFLIAILVIVIVNNLLQVPSNNQQSGNPFAILSFVGCIWLLLFNLLLSIFNDIPSTDNQPSMFKRLKSRVQRYFYQLLAILFIGLTLVIVFLTIRILRV
jgi:hypothetical protein